MQARFICSRAELAALATLALTASLATGSAAIAAAPPALAPCVLPGLVSGARCATYPVFENRDAKRGRTLGLQVVVVPATSGKPTDEAITYFAGGPGDASTRIVDQLAHYYAAARSTRDLVVVDFRGTGGSAPLDCSELVAAGAQGFLDSFLPTAEVAACRARLERDHDLALYTTNEAVDDIAEVFSAYGYKKINLDGGSYGTRAVQIFARRHPELVRTMILEGVMRLSERDPLDFARAAQNALDELFAECAGDAACASAFPDPKGDLAKAFARLDAGPVSVDLLDAASGEKRPLRISKNGLAQTIRYMLYVVSSSLSIPFQLHAAAQGDFRPIAESAQFFGNLMTDNADGFFLSVTCPEDTRFIREEEIAPAVAGTFLGDFRIRQQLAACAAWAPRAPDPAFQAPLESAAPTLLLSGERDPVTPAANGELVASHLAHARHVVVADGAHGDDGLNGIDCIERVANAFVEAGSVEGLDLSCFGQISRPPFVVVGPAPTVALTAAQLAPLVGHYRHPEAGFEIAIEIAGDSLRLAFGGQPPIGLRSISPERFEPIGLPPGYAVEFERDASGQAVALSFFEPGQPPARLPRIP